MRYQASEAHLVIGALHGHPAAVYYPLPPPGPTRLARRPNALVTKPTTAPRLPAGQYWNCRPTCKNTPIKNRDFIASDTIARLRLASSWTEPKILK